MARLRDAYPEFTRRGAEILAIGPDGPAAFDLYWRAERLPFIGLADPRHRVARQFRQEVNLFKLGRMPLVMVIDGQGVVRFAHRGDSMADIPGNSMLLDVLERIQTTPAESSPMPNAASRQTKTDGRTV